MVIEDSLKTVAEVAHELHVHPNTLRKWCDKGILKTYRIGPRGDRRFKPKDVTALLNNNLQQKAPHITN